MTKLAKRMSRPAAAALAACLLLASCGGDDDGSSDQAEDTRSEAERAADQVLAESAVLTLADVPAGWEAEPADEDEDDASNPELTDTFAECLDVDPALFEESGNPSAESPTFVSPTGLEVQSEVSVTQSGEWATERFELYGHERIPSCLESAFQDLIDNPEPGDEPPPDVEYGDIVVAPISLSTLGDGTHAFRITIPASADDLEVEVFMDMVVVLVGRVGVTMTFQSVFEPFPPEGVEELTRVVVDRLSVDL